jgi:5-methylcytosine-specific restriction enzyme A
MPRASTPCPTPGCPTLTPSGGACEKHKRERRRKQARQRRASGDPSMDAYTTHTWRTNTRPTYLHTHPTCARCGAKATEVDHTPPRQLLVALGIHEPDHEQWLTSLCQSCHATKTARIDKPLLNRWQHGEDAQTIAEQAMTATVTFLTPNP